MVAYEKIYFALRKVDLRWSLFRDAPDIHEISNSAHGKDPLPVRKICEYQSHPGVHWENLTTQLPFDISREACHSRFKRHRGNMKFTVLLPAGFTPTQFN